MLHFSGIVFAVPLGIVRPVPSKVKLVEDPAADGFLTFDPLVIEVEPSYN